MRPTTCTTMMILLTLATILSCTIANEYPVTLLDDIARNKDQCKDIEDFRVIIDEEAGKLAPCSWIDDGHNFEEVSFRREAQCTKPYVRIACKRACGTCCGNNNDHTFEYTNSETNAVKDVNCAWLAGRSEAFKKKMCSTKKGSCPEACGCNETPMTYPKETSCQDDPTFKISFDEEPGRLEPCSWIDDAANIDGVLSRREEVCWRKDVENACKRACGECCGDNDMHLFERTNMETGVTKLVTCEWLANSTDKKKNNICPMQSGSCPKACGECKNETEDPSGLTGACRDKPEFRLEINAETGRKVPCSWIDDAQNIDDVIFRRKAQCRKKAVKRNCKRACGECCGDNDEHIFEYTNIATGTKKEANCAWLASSSEKKRKKLCQTKKGSCPEACSECSTEVDTTTEEDGDKEDTDFKPPTSGAGLTTSETIRHRVSILVSIFSLVTTMFALVSI